MKFSFLFSVKITKLILWFQDLENLNTIVLWVAWSEPDFDFRPILKEWTDAVPKELDFDIEAGMDVISI